jgi:hypothetical protein
MRDGVDPASRHVRARMCHSASALTYIKVRKWLLKLISQNALTATSELATLCKNAH